MKKIHRIFTLNNQNEFALLSGDFNPIHLDLAEAKKTHAGEPIVHGIHLLLWSLDILRIELKICDKIKVDFNSQLNLNQKIKVLVNKSKTRIQILGYKNVVHCLINIEKKNDDSQLNPNNFIVNFNKKILTPDNLNFKDVNIDDKCFDIVGGNKEKVKKLFPFLTTKLGKDLVYEIACLSSIVGMKIPGKDSLFSAVNLSFTEEKGEKYFYVRKKHKVFKSIEMNYLGVNINASIKAFFRPKSVPTETIKTLKNKYRRSEIMKNKKILIVGGSRGLGAYLTKFSIINGAHVTFTYNTCKKDALLIYDEAKSNGSYVILKKIDILLKKDIRNLSGDYDQIYFLATPKIISNKLSFDKNIYDYYKSYYVDGFTNLIKNFIRKQKTPSFFFPSTTFIDENKFGFSEYIKAKIDGEEICKLFQKKYNIKVKYLRIPQLETDQNLSIIPSKNSKTSDEAIKILNSMS